MIYDIWRSIDGANDDYTSSCAITGTTIASINNGTTVGAYNFKTSICAINCINDTNTCVIDDAYDYNVSNRTINDMV